MYHLLEKSTSPTKDVTSPPSNAGSPADAVSASSNFGICDTAENIIVKTNSTSYRVIARETIEVEYNLI
jgi:hypothetical protein